MRYLVRDPFDFFFDFHRVVYTDTSVVSDGTTRRVLKNGALHNEDGPALIRYDTSGKVALEEYYLDGVKSTKEEVLALKQKKEDETVHTITLGGKQYKATGKKLRELSKQLGLEEVLLE